MTDCSKKSPLQSLLSLCGITASTLRPLWAGEPSHLRDTGTLHYVCLHGCICMCKLVYLCVCLCFWTRMYACVCLCTSVRAHTRTCIGTCICVCMYVRVVSVCACLGLCAGWCLCECVLYRQPPLEGMPVLLLGARCWCRGEGSAGCRKKIQRRRKYGQGAEPSVSPWVGTLRSSQPSWAQTGHRGETGGMRARLCCGFSFRKYIFQTSYRSPESGWWGPGGP